MCTLSYFAHVTLQEGNAESVGDVCCYGMSILLIRQELCGCRESRKVTFNKEDLRKNNLLSPY